MTHKGINSIWNEEATRNFHLYRITAELVGVWPFTCQTWLSKFRFVFCTSVLITMAIMLSRDIVDNCGDVNNQIQSAVLIPSSIMSILKISLTRIHWKNMRAVIISATNDWLNDNNNEALKIMEKNSSIGRMAFVVLLGGAEFVSVLIIIQKYLFMRTTSNSNNNSTVINVALGSGCWRSSFSMEIHLIFVIQSIQLFILQWGCSGTDACYYQIISHINGQFEILKMNFKLSSSIKKKEQFHAITYFIKRHDHLLTQCNHLEKTFNFSIAFNMALDLGFISGTMIIVMTNWGNQDFTELILYGYVIVFLYIQMLLACLAGEAITRQTEILHNHIYDYPWYNLLMNDKKNILFILTRTTTPMYLSVGKLYHLNLDTFKKFVKVSGSFFSILRLLLNKP